MAGRAALLWPVLSNAAADGKPPCAIDASGGCGPGRQPAGLVSPLGSTLGLAAAFGLAGFAAGLSAAAAGLSPVLGATASGLALACRTAAGLAACLVVASAFGAAAASGFLAATRERLPRFTVCCSESTATAAISAAPVLVGPV